MTTPIDDAAARVLEVLAAVELPFATRDSKAFEATWSVICKRAGAKLEVHSSRKPTNFAALAHAKPRTAVSLEGVAPGDEVAVLALAAERLTVAAGTRAIPFTLLHGSRDEKIVCGAAVPGGVSPVVIAVGHGEASTAPLEAVLIGRDRVVALGLDSNSEERFGVVVLDETSGAIERVDFDGRLLGLRVGATERRWRLEREATEAEKAASLELTTALGVPLRRYVAVNETTRELRVVDELRSNLRT